MYKTAGALPDRYKLLQNYPNPFNPSTTITYLLPERAQVRLTVFDLLGRQVRLLDAGVKEAGVHRMRFEARGLSNGAYLYKLTAAEFESVRRMVLLK